MSAEPKLSDWARGALAWVPRGAVPLLDARRVTVDEYDAHRRRWAEAWPLERIKAADSSLVELQEMSAWASDLARRNPHGLVGDLLVGWQKHSATVARNVRAEFCRVLGVTGIELWAIEALDLTFAEAVVVSEDKAVVDLLVAMR